MRNPWINSLEAVFDLLLDDYYDGHPNWEALLSNDFDSIGIACNCHAWFGQICVFEMTSTLKHSGAALGASSGLWNGGVTDTTPCIDVCYDMISLIDTTFANI